MNLGIYGAGGLGREVLELAKQMEQESKQWEQIFFIDERDFDEDVNGASVKKFSEVINSYSPSEIQFSIAVGEPTTREKLWKKIKSHGYSCATLIHPCVYIPETTMVKEGTVIQVNSFVSCNVCIGENAYVQPMSLIGHDVQIGANSVISTNVAIGGACVIGERVYIGLNVPVKELLTIGSDSVIGMGSVVIRDIPENVIAMGNPARPMKKKDGNTVF